MRGATRSFEITELDSSTYDECNRDVSPMDRTQVRVCHQLVSCLEIPAPRNAMDTSVALYL